MSVTFEEVDHGMVRKTLSFAGGLSVEFAGVVEGPGRVRFVDPVASQGTLTEPARTRGEWIPSMNAGARQAPAFTWASCERWCMIRHATPGRPLPASRIPSWP